jgi:hypothetical protein
MPYNTTAATNAYLQQIIDAQAEAQKTDAALKTVEEQQQKLFNEKAAGELAKGAINAEETKRKGVLELGLQTKIQQQASQLGINPSDPANIISELTASQLAATKNLSRATSELQAIDSANFLDNPLSWIVDQFRRPYVEQDVSSANTQRMAAQAAIADASKSLNELSLIDKNTTETVTNASIESQARKDLLTARAIANDVEISAISANVGLLREHEQNIKDLVGLSNQRLGAMFNANQEARAIESEARAREAHSLSMQIHRDQLAKLKEDSDAESNYVASIKQGLSIKGASKEYINSLSDATLKSDLRLGSKERKAELAQYAEVGMRSKAFGSSLIASTLPESINFFVSGTGKLDGFKKASPAVGEYVERLVSKLPANLSQDQLLGQIKLKSDADFAAMAREIDPETPNIYKAKSASLLLKAAPDIQQLPIWKQFIAPELARGNDVDLSRPESLVKQIAGLIDNGANPSTWGVQFSKLYSAVTSTNNTLENYQGIGVPKQTSYRYNPIGWSIGNIDLSNPTDATLYIQNRVKNQGWTPNSGKRPTI